MLDVSSFSGSRGKVQFAARAPLISLRFDGGMLIDSN